MNESFAIKVDNVSKAFRLPHEKQSSIKGALINFRKRGYEKQEVLKDINFEIKKGEFFGIVGRNGSGKSTLLKLLAGIYSPDQGEVHVRGKLTPFIELGVGFNPELTGRENVYLNGALLGFSRKDMDLLYDEIVSFAELGRFMDQKLKNYSSGMQVRLAFSIAIRAKSEILLIDEVLAVGDAAFQKKCFDYFYKLKKTGVTVIFVSHDRASLERFCDRGILIDDGEMRVSGNIKKVLEAYNEVVLDEIAAPEVKKEERISVLRTKQVQNYSVKTIDIEGQTRTKFKYGEPIRIEFSVTSAATMRDPIIGITVWESNTDRAIIATNTLIENIKESGTFKKGDSATVVFSLPLELNDGEYRVEAAVANDSATSFYLQDLDGPKFYIDGSRNPHSVLSGVADAFEFRRGVK